MLFASRIYIVRNDETRKTLKKVSSMDKAMEYADKYYAKGQEVRVYVDDKLFYDPSPLDETDGFLLGDAFDTQGRVDDESKKTKGSDEE